ncbi:MAG: S9 family peptidase [Planctomycetes bacterium]|nr:S9 family peptidase [Planctomycetota bacterium]
MILRVVLPSGLALLAVACASRAVEQSGALSARDAASGVGRERLTIDQLYDPKLRVDFSGPARRPVNWIDGTHWLEKRAAEKATDKAAQANPADAWVLVDAVTGATQPAADMARGYKALEALKDEKTGKLPGAPSLERMTKDRSAMLVTKDNDLWVVRLDTQAAVRITNTPDVEEEEETFSPDGKYVAFVAKNNLWVGDCSAGGAKALTSDGSEMVLNGKLNWIYQEEIYGRGTFRAYWWSPDSTRIAHLRLDDTGVPLYTLVDDSSYAIKVETSGYPRPGETNPTVKLGVANVADGALRFVDLSAYASVEPLVVDVSWSPKNELMYCVQDREQTWLDLRSEDARGQNDRVLFRETSPAWVERNDQSPLWLEDGTFLWLSERGGFKHIYRYRGETLVGALTSGEWEVRTLHGVDERKGLVYFSGTERSPIGSDAYVVGLDGKGMKRLTDAPGTHNVTFSTDYSFFVDAWSDIWTPTQVSLRRTNGELVRVLDENKVDALARFALSKPELHTVKTRDGFEMEAMLIKPVDFDPKRRYPVMMFVYAGPHSQTVRNAWGGTGGMFQQMLAQRGVIVWSCDNRTASGKGQKSTWPGYQRMGETELADIEDSIQWLVQQGFVDEQRIGITGWSYGGFMTCYALTHSKTFSLGLAGGSVTDWRLYDSIYTERYMRLPKNNEKGYDGTSVIKVADQLHGKLVLVHGQMDDNVHVQNTLRLAHALQRAGKDFELMIYPKSRHGLGDPLQTKHWRALMWRAMAQTWGLEEAG